MATTPDKDGFFSLNEDTLLGHSKINTCGVVRSKKSVLVFLFTVGTVSLAVPMVAVSHRHSALLLHS